MLFTLKNDVLAIEYPVQHFISEALRHGENPVWFNSWCMGFPLQSVLTWSVFSTPRTLLGTLLPSDIVVLHLEFLFYVMAAGWIMFALLKNHFSTEKNLALLLSCCYMLSGFTVGSSQWLLYLTGLSFIPLVIYAALSFFRTPRLLTSFFLALTWYLLLTNVHIYLTVVTGYILTFLFIGRLLFYLTNKTVDKAAKKRLTRYTLAALLLTLAFSAAPIYYTLELLPWLERSTPLEAGQQFFQSNYLHPVAGMKSLLLPLSTIKSAHANTEGSIQTIYMGLLPLLLLIPSIRKNIKEKNINAGWILFFSIFFLILSLGHLTPLRQALNFLPGMSFFRHPGVLRAYFIMGFIIYLGISFRQQSLISLLKTKGTERKLLIGLLIFLGSFLLILILSGAGSLENLWKGSFNETVRQADYQQLEVLNSMLQLIMIASLLFALLRKTILFYTLLLLELILNFLCCTPYYMVSSYSAAEVNQMYSYTRGFPVQQKPTYHLPVEISEKGTTVWRNINTFRKDVSTEISMPGPLVLEKVGQFLSSPGKESLIERKLVFIRGESVEMDTVNIIQQGPGKVVANLQLSAPREIVLQQGYFPGWKVFYNGKELPLVKNEYPFIAVKAPAGKGELVFRFRKDGVLYSAVFMHCIVLLGLFLGCRHHFRFKSSSPSSPN
ncbi:MAG: hypothetical protein IPP99_15425 [Chitinophagaceae bacterium]|nr:hypothetical protein [Chitinophagaceae bacterium]